MVKQTQGEMSFWNDAEMAAYFAAKPADPRIREFVATHIEDLGGQSALDLGCGGGRHSEFLAELGFDVVSVDPNEGMRRATQMRLASRGLDAVIREGEILAIPADDEEFNLVVTTGVLHQANSSAEYEQALSELYRVMRRGAYVCLNIFTNSAWDPAYRTVSEDGYSVMTAEDLPMTLWPKDHFVDRMEDHGFTLVSDYPEEVRPENTGQRAVYRANFKKRP